MVRRKRTKYFKNLSNKRWHGNQNEPTTSFSDNDSGDNFDDAPEVPTNVRITKKVDLLENKLDTTIACSDEYVFLDFSQLSKLLITVKCSECDGKCLEFDLSIEKYGFARKISIVCKDCELIGLETVKSEIYTSKRINNSKSTRPSFDINVRLCTAFSFMGKGYSGLEQFSMIMNMNIFSNSCFDDYVSLLNKSAEKSCKSVLDECRELAKQANKKIPDESDQTENHLDENELDILDLDSTCEQIFESCEDEQSDQNSSNESENYIEEMEALSDLEEATDDEIEKNLVSKENEKEKQANEIIRDESHNLEKESDSFDNSIAVETTQVEDSGASEKDEKVNSGVSYDGSWPTKGYSSKHGFGAAIDILTGYVMDFDTASKYCHICEIAAKELDKDSPDFYFWYQGHADSCSINHQGSSGAMETTIAEIIWKRSESYGFRFTTMLADGDSKTFNHLSSLNVYGPEYSLMKEECINHVSKRYIN